MVRVLLLLLLAVPMSAQVARRVLSIDACAPFIELDDVDGLQAGDVVLVYQNQQRDTTTTPAGSWETAVIDEVVGTLVFLQAALRVPFDVESSVQAVRVDIASTLRIDAPISTRPYRDGVGGVRMFAADTIVLSAPISADAFGFPGGRRSISGWDTSWVADTAVFLSGAAGEVGRSAFHAAIERAGRRSWHSGGGGGNARNAGGGGGGNGGVGGNGGRQLSAYEALDLGGQGALPSQSSLPIMGGGGGGGHQNDFLGSDGGRGGGVIILRCDALVVEGAGAISARGGAASLALNDGAGGGGAGGSVVVDADTIIGRLTVDVSGGAGGSTLGEWYCYGPGGGGGGGTVFAPVRLQPLFNATMDGGSAGSATGVGPCETDIAYGATSGGDGRVRTLQRGSGVDSLCAPPDVIVRGLDAAGHPGERVEIPFEIEVLSTLSTSVRLTLWVRCRASVLVPEGAYRWAGSRAAVRFTNITVPAGPPRVLIETMAYTCALGDSATIGIGIDTAFVDDNDVSVHVDRHGTFTIDGVCEQGGRARLFDPWQAVPGREVFDVRGRRLDPRTEPDLRLTVPGSQGRVLIVPR